MFKFFQRQALILFFALIFSGFASTVEAQDVKAVENASKGKTPIIIIPGLTGSELVNSKNQEIVWFKPGRAKDDDLRLPISPNLARNRDSLRTGDIIRGVQFIKFLPEIEIYEKLIDSLEKRGGYKEGKIDSPPAGGFEDTFYVFPYDWRRDNVENARLLMQKIDSLKRKFKRPKMKFNIIAHSMGGLIARYAAMYGNADLSRSGRLRPTWAGARNFDKIFLLGTPNEGSVQALDSLLNGFSLIGGGLNLPFVQNLSRFDVFTIPSIFQLLPHQGTFTAYDENLKPLKIDIYDPKNWDTYDWSIWKDDDFTKKFTPAEQRQAKAYFNVVINRARRFQEALNANTTAKSPVSFYLMGADCKETQTAVLLLRNEKKNRWETHFKASGFERANGEKVTSDELKKLIYSLGDGVVTKASLKMENLNKPSILPVESELFQCESHNKLATNPEITDKLFTILDNRSVTAAK
jgi:pimeloyl-ACP methyl ester carboxylesterase